jgi:hypothetical protein
VLLLKLLLMLLLILLGMRLLAAYAAYDAAWDAVDAYKAELKKNREKSYHNVSNQPEMGGSDIRSIRRR